MIKSLSHIAIVVPNLEEAGKHYQKILGGDLSQPQDLPEHGVSALKLQLPNCLIEFLHPLGDNSPIQKFLDKNPEGGFHHICFGVDDLEDQKNRTENSVRYLNDGKSKIGMDGNPVLFIHPKDMLGTLIELEEIGD